MDQKTDSSSSVSTLFSRSYRMTSKNLFANLYQEISNSSLKMQVYSIKKPKLSLDSLLTAKMNKDYMFVERKNDFCSDLTKFNNLPSIDSVDAIKCSSMRLRKLKSILENSSDLYTHVSKGDLLENLEYFLNVFEAVLIEAKRRVSDDDDNNALSDVESDQMVPNEVRNWLSMTFTRSVSNKKQKIEDKPKFKAVAHAIRAGILVDRMLRRMSSSLQNQLPENVATSLGTIKEWNFDVFLLNEISSGQSLRYVTIDIFSRYQLMQKFKIPSLVMSNFLESMETGYEKYGNPYHNSVHAADVLQTTFNILSSSALVNWLNDLEIFATFFSAVIHDYEHTGTTNNFHIQSKSDFALCYNDRAILENYHISAAFKLMLNDSCNIINDLSRDQYKEFRQLVIEIVLATDMSFHFTQLKNMKNVMNLGETIDKTRALSLIVHCADIGHPSKHWNLHEKWTNLLMNEFFAQGDKEKELGLPFSPLCDREKTPVALSQIGFINFIVDPSFVLMGDMIDKIFEQILAEDMKRQSNSDIVELTKNEIKPVPIVRPWSEHLFDNRSKWQQLADAEKKKKDEEEELK